jgi:hypothetical protein
MLGARAYPQTYRGRCKCGTRPHDNIWRHQYASTRGHSAKSFKDATTSIEVRAKLRRPPNGIQRPPNRTQTHHTYHQNIMDRSQSLPESAQHAPFSIIQDGLRSEPMEMEEPSFGNPGPLNHPHSPPYRRNFSNPTYGVNQILHFYIFLNDLTGLYIDKQ